MLLPGQAQPRRMDQGALKHGLYHQNPLHLPELRAGTRNCMRHTCACACVQGAGSILHVGGPHPSSRGPVDPHDLQGGYG